jgi:hypothetical protein
VLKEKAHGIDVAVEGCENERSVSVSVTEVHSPRIFPQRLLQARYFSAERMLVHGLICRGRRRRLAEKSGTPCKTQDKSAADDKSEWSPAALHFRVMKGSSSGNLDSVDRAE